MKKTLKLFANGFINSYSQLFFADSKVFAWLLLLSSFINPIMGVSGAIATFAGLLFSYWIGLNRTSIGYGTYSYNALMIGLVLGAQYQLNLPFIVLLLVATVLSVFIAVWFNTILLKYNLPSLSLSFLITLWLIIIGLRTFDNVTLSETGLYRYNEWYTLGGEKMVNFMNQLEAIKIPDVIDVYLKSLSAVFFQYNIIAGVIILIGLIIWSRIAFLLSIIGFSMGYVFYFQLSGEFSQLYYSYIGFNFILTAISLGGFYLIPSRSSFLLVIIAMPIIGVLISGLSGLLSVYQLPLYSLPFVITVLLVLMLLSKRTYFNRLVPVTFQHFSPEKNIYNYASNQTRFKNSKWINLQLPFYGEWFVSQGYNGKITHKALWSEALDFVVVDETKKTYKQPGTSTTDFYCFNLPVLAPADGYIVQIADGIDDNNIGDVDLKDNWGNTIVIKHAEGLYTKLSHLKKDTLLVQLNDFVKAGQMLASCGNSGRSPEPHLHFQVQNTPYIGSKTMAYPIANYVSTNNGKYQLHQNSIPLEGTQIHHPIKTPLLTKAYHFIPGKVLKFEVKNASNKNKIITWECLVDAYNNTYLYCPTEKAYAYFVNNGTTFYFTTFYGNKKSVLFDFYLANYKILLGYYPSLTVTDDIDLTHFNSPIALLIQDLIAPFVLFKKVKYQIAYISIDDMILPNKIELLSSVEAFTFSKKTKQRTFKIEIENNQITSITINANGPNTKTISCLN